MDDYYNMNTRGKRKKRIHIRRPIYSIPLVRWLSFLIWRRRGTQTWWEKETWSWFCGRARSTESTVLLNCMLSCPISPRKMKACLCGQIIPMHNEDYLFFNSLLGNLFIINIIIKVNSRVWYHKGEWIRMPPRADDFWTLRKYIFLLKAHLFHLLKYHKDENHTIQKGYIIWQTEWQY